MPGHQKFDQATKQVATYLFDHGIQVNMAAIQAVVQAAYEKSPLTPTTIPEVKSDNLSDLVPGTVEAIDPMKGDN